MIDKMQYSREGLKSTLRVKEQEVAELPTRRLSPRPARRKRTVPGESAELQRRTATSRERTRPQRSSSREKGRIFKNTTAKNASTIETNLNLHTQEAQQAQLRGTRGGPRPAENGERATREASLRGSLKRGRGRGRRALCAPCLGPGGCCPAAELSPGRARNVPGSPATWPHPRRANISVFLLVPAFFYLI